MPQKISWSVVPQRAADHRPTPGRWCARSCRGRRARASPSQVHHCDDDRLVEAERLRCSRDDRGRVLRACGSFAQRVERDADEPEREERRDEQHRDRVERCAGAMYVSIGRLPPEIDAVDPAESGRAHA